MHTLWEGRMDDGAIFAGHLQFFGRLFFIAVNMISLGLLCS